MLKNYKMFSNSYLSSNSYGFWKFYRNYLVVGTVLSAKQKYLIVSYWNFAVSFEKFGTQSWCFDGPGQPCCRLLNKMWRDFYCSWPSNRLLQT